MITGITGGPYVTVTNGTGGVYYNNNTNPLSGTVRYNNNGQVEMYDGYAWRQVSQTPSIQLTKEAIDAITWAFKKMKEEQELEQKAQNNPAIKAALENWRRAEEQLKTTLILSEE